MPHRLQANPYLDRAIDELELARRTRVVEDSLRHSRAAAANAYVAVIVLHGATASIDTPLRDLIERAAGFVELDPCAADAWEIEDHVEDPHYEHAILDARLLANATVTWAQDVFGDHPD